MIAFPAERTYLQNEPVAVPRRTVVESTVRSSRPEAREGSRNQESESEARASDSGQTAVRDTTPVADPSETKGVYVDLVL